MYKTNKLSFIHIYSRAAQIFIKVNYTLRQYAKTEQSIPKLFTKTAKRYPNRVAFYFEDQLMTFQEVSTFTYFFLLYIKQCILFAES